MPQKRISTSKIKRLIVLDSITKLNKSELCEIVKISKSTANKYLNQFKKSNLIYTDIKKLTGQDLINALGFKKPYYSKKYELFKKELPAIHEKLDDHRCQMNRKLIVKVFCDGYYSSVPIYFGMLGEGFGL